jgi:hypothetical protein
VTGADQDDGSNNLSFFMVGAYIMAIAALTIYNRCFGWAVQLAPCDPDGTSKAVSRHVHSLTLAVHILSAERPSGGKGSPILAQCKALEPCIHATNIQQAMAPSDRDAAPQGCEHAGILYSPPIARPCRGTAGQEPTQPYFGYM